MVRAIALVEPSRRGLYLTAGIFDKVGTTGSRSESASLSRALCRLAERGVVERDDGFFTLTEAGCALVNEVRAERGLSPLTYTPYVPEPPMSQEEIQRRLQERCLLIERLREEWQVLDTPKALANAKKEAEKMTPAGLEELRRWIEARQAAQNG